MKTMARLHVVLWIGLILIAIGLALSVVGTVLIHADPGNKAAITGSHIWWIYGGLASGVVGLVMAFIGAISMFGANKSTTRSIIQPPTQYNYK